MRLPRRSKGFINVGLWSNLTLAVNFTSLATLMNPSRSIVQPAFQSTHVPVSMPAIIMLCNESHRRPRPMNKALRVLIRPDS